MPTTLQFRRGTTAQNAAFTGAAGEITVDTDIDTILVHDGSTQGGFEVTSRSAKYADVAERYQADAVYEPGTVVIVGGENEITQSTQKMDRRVLGVVSTEPYLIMNSPHREEDQTDDMNPAIGLLGRVPTKVSGYVRKGDLMITSTEPGVAEAWREESSPPAGSIIGKSLQDKDSRGIEVIEVVVGAK